MATARVSLGSIKGIYKGSFKGIYKGPGLVSLDYMGLNA